MPSLTYQTYYTQSGSLFKRVKTKDYLWNTKRTKWESFVKAPFQPKVRFISKDEARFMYPAAFSNKNKLK